MEPSLFRRFPALRHRVPYHSFLSGPTPVQAVALPGLPGDRLLVKRDDRCCPIYGGNKPRKLEFVIGDALARGTRRLVTTGGLGTNHGLATTLLGRSVGLETTLVLLRQPITADVRAKLHAFVGHGAEVAYAPTVPGIALRTLGVLARSALRGERPYRVATGGSSTLGTLGFVSAGLELGEQVEAGLLAEPAHLFVAAGTGGSLAGLIAGLRLAGLRTRVTGVVVTDVLAPTARRVVRTAERALAFLRRAGADVPPLRWEPADLSLVRDQVGPGYGASTPAAVAAVESARAVGLRLETTYTGKCLAAIQAMAARRAIDAGPVLFWNTYNAVDVTPDMPFSAAMAELPRRVRELVDGVVCRGSPEIC